MSLKEYLTHRKSKSAKTATHLEFVGGKYTVKDEELFEFNKKYYEEFKNKSLDLFLIEKINEGDKFAFFMDLEASKENEANGNYLKKDTVDEIINHSVLILKTYFEENVNFEYVLCKRNERYHIIFHDLIVNQKIANFIIEKIKIKDYKDFIDSSVYKTGLRMLGSLKERNTDSYYKICKNGILIENEETDFQTFLKTTIRRKTSIQTSNLKKDLVAEIEVQKQTKGGDLNAFISFINKIKSYNFGNVDKVIYAKNKAGEYCYYANIENKYCPFKEREHSRASSPIYIEFGKRGLFVKCYDSDCEKQKLEIEIPEELVKEYKTIFNFPIVKDSYFTESQKHILNKIKPTDYDIAKCIFELYKSQFRIDDLKNTEWYEYVSNKWQKTTNINLLLSEKIASYLDLASIKYDNNENDDSGNENLVMDKLSEMYSIIAKKLKSNNYKKIVLNELAYFFKNYDKDFVSKLDSSPNLLAFENGVYDLNKLEFRKTKPDDYITFSTGYDYIEYDENDGDIKDIIKFLSKIITSKHILEYLLKILGRSLSGIPDEKFYIFTGLAGANGKSTLINFLEHALGDYIVSSEVEMLTQKKAISSSASPDIFRLRGKRFVSFQEPETHDRLRAGIIKQFSGGDTVVARELYKSPISFKLQCSLFLCCNELPSISSVDGGIMRRLRVVEFKSRFCDKPQKLNEFKIDPEIKTKIYDWRAKFMAILIHYYKKQKLEGIEEPKEVLIATDNYKFENDKFNEFIVEHLVEEFDSFTPFKDIYSRFCLWWSEFNKTKVPEPKLLKNAIKIRFGEEVFDDGKNGFNVRYSYDF